MDYNKILIVSLLIAVGMSFGLFYIKISSNVNPIVSAPLDVLTSTTNSSGVCLAASSQLIAGNSGRAFLNISNLDSTTSPTNQSAFVCLSASCTAQTGIEITPGSIWKMETSTPYVGPISCITNSAGSGAKLMYSVSQ
jgi:hypothetical protein